MSIDSQAVAREGSRLAPWRTFEIKKDPSLLDRVLRSVKVPTQALVALRRNSPACCEEQILSTILLTPADFGLEGQVTPRALFCEQRIAMWNRMRQHDSGKEVRLKLLTQDEWLSVRDQYKDQPRGERLVIAAEGSALGQIFTIGCDSGGNAWIHFERFGSSDTFRDNQRALFGLEMLSEESPAEAPVPESQEVPESDIAFGADGHIRSLAEIEAHVIRIAISRYRGRMTEVARRLGIGRSTLYRKLGEHEIERADS